MSEEQLETRQKKKPKKKKRKKKHYILRFLLFVALCVGLYYFFTSEVFDIQKIEVQENNHYTAEQIIEMSKIKPGQNLFETSMSKAKKRLLSDSYVKDIKIQRKLPGTVVITVTERIEYAAVPYGEEYIWIDKEAVVLVRTDKAPELPLLMGMTVKTIEPGQVMLVEESNTLEETLAMLSAMEESDLYFKKIDISNVVIKAYIYDNLICEGTPENITKGMDGLRKLIYELYKKGIERGVIKASGDHCWAWSPLIE